jgi:hypothetical protein
VPLERSLDCLFAPEYSRVLERGHATERKERSQPADSRRDFRGLVSEVDEIESLLILLPDTPAVYAPWKRIIVDHNVSGVQVAPKATASSTLPAPCRSLQTSLDPSSSVRPPYVLRTSSASSPLFSATSNTGISRTDRVRGTYTVLDFQATLQTCATNRLRIAEVGLPPADPTEHDLSPGWAKSKHQSGPIGVDGSICGIYPLRRQSKHAGSHYT